MENGEDHQDEDHSDEHSPFVPDLGLPNDENVNHGQEGDGGAAPKSAGAPGGGGGGEAPLSFRRFLETAGGQASPMGLGRPDVAAGLPDFVQDHLAAAPAALDDRERLRPAEREPPPAAAATGTRRKVPTSLSCAAGGAAAPLAAPQPRGLPDFLSDGPMGTLHADAETNGALHCAARPHDEASPQRLQRLERENACLRRDIDRLQQQLQYERRRSSSLQQQVAQAASPAGGGAADPAATDPRLLEEVRSLRRQNAELRRRLRPRPASHQAATQIVAAATGAEQLISQLMAGVRSLRTIAATMEAEDADDDDPPPEGSPC